MKTSKFIETEGIGFISSESEESFFSWSPCECCNSTLGGDRYTIKAKYLETNEIFKYDVCVDCYPELV